MSKIAAAHSAFPRTYHPQHELTSAFIKYLEVDDQKARIIERLHRSVGVSGRHLSLPMEAFAFAEGFTLRNKAWGEVALALGEQCVNELLEKCGAQPTQISQIFFTTVTGLSVPSIDARLMNKIPFRSDLKRLPIFGLGCVAGASGIARAHDYLKGHPQDAVLLLAIELCSLTIQKGDVSMANFVSCGLFGDGAAAALIVGDEHELANDSFPSVVSSRSIFFPKTEGVMGWDIGSAGFQIILSAEVPVIAETILSNEIRTFLGAHGLQVEDIATWISHPGGPKVIDGIEKGLSLETGALDLSRECLREVGNLSSASVLIVLQKTLAKKQLPKGSYGLLLAMGPAFCAELVLLKW